MTLTWTPPVTRTVDRQHRMMTLVARVADTISLLAIVAVALIALRADNAPPAVFPLAVAAFVFALIGRYVRRVEAGRTARH